MSKEKHEEEEGTLTQCMSDCLSLHPLLMQQHICKLYTKESNWLV